MSTFPFSPASIMNFSIFSRPDFLFPQTGQQVFAVATPISVCFENFELLISSLSYLSYNSL